PRRPCAPPKSSQRARPRLTPRPLLRRPPRQRRPARRPRCFRGRSALNARRTASAPTTAYRRLFPAPLSPKAYAAPSHAPSTRSVPVRRPAVIPWLVAATALTDPVSSTIAGSGANGRSRRVVFPINGRVFHGLADVRAPREPNGEHLAW